MRTTPFRERIGPTLIRNINILQLQCSGIDDLINIIVSQTIDVNPLTVVKKSKCRPGFWVTISVASQNPLSQRCQSSTTGGYIEQPSKVTRSNFEACNRMELVFINVTCWSRLNIVLGIRVNIYKASV
jgi:hypothetical protein